MTMHPGDAAIFAGRLVAAIYNGDRDGYNSTYAEALSLDNAPNYPMHSVVHALITRVIDLVADELEAEYSSADALIRDALKDVSDPWQSNS